MELLLLIPLLILIRSDFRERQVRVFILLLFGGLQWGICLIESEVAVIVERIVENLLLLMVWGGGVCVCFWLRRPSVTKRGQKYIGEGDIAFLICLLPVFPVRGFLLFLLVSFGTGLLYWILRGMMPHDTIPLVSMFGICYFPVLISQMYGC